MLVLGGEEESICEALVDWNRMEYVSDFKYLRCVVDELDIDGAEYRRKKAIGRRVEGAIRLLVIAKSLQLEYLKVLYEALLAPVLFYGIETMVWKEKKRSRVMAVQFDDLRGLLNIRGMNKVQNAWIRELCIVMEGVGERNDESVL